jgi:hypothetical protein
MAIFGWGVADFIIYMYESTPFPKLEKPRS